MWLQRWTTYLLRYVIAQELFTFWASDESRGSDSSNLAFGYFLNFDSRNFPRSREGSSDIIFFNSDLTLTLDLEKTLSSIQIKLIEEITNRNQLQFSSVTTKDALISFIQETPNVFLNTRLFQNKKKKGLSLMEKKLIISGSKRTEEIN